MKKGRFGFLGKFALVIGFAAIGFGAVEGYRVYSQFDQSYHQLERGTKSEKRVEEVKMVEDPVSVLLLGVEDYATSGVGGRADSIMIATIQPKTKTIKLVSIPRDSYVEIEGHGYTKINHAYAYGGKELTIQTVENFLDIPIDYYVQVDFKGFKKIVDELDGVTVNVPFDFTEQSDEEKVGLHFKKGTTTLDGEHALAYARMRKHDPNGDFGRADRQKEIVIALTEKLASPKYWWKVGDIASHIGEYTETNVRVADALSIAKTYKGFEKSQVEVLHVEGTGEKIDGIYYFKADEEVLKEVQGKLYDHLKGIEFSEESEQGTKTIEEESHTQ